jgi:hypothetical protein
MSTRIVKLALLGSGALVAICVAGLALTLLPVRHEWARQRWEQRRPRHYELEVSWAHNWSFGHARVEIRDGRLVGGIDLDTGRSLEVNKRGSAAYFGSIDRLFALIEWQTRPAERWQDQLARYHPQLARRLNPCAAPLPAVRYDAEYGYPTDIDYYDTECIARFFNRSSVTIRHFRPLP